VPIKEIGKTELFLQPFRDTKEIRKRAIFWLGQSSDPRAVDALVEIVKTSE
jgi:hypothetical protein